MESREKKRVVLDVSTVHKSAELHALLRKELKFPEFYGMNWDAFWDVITGMVELPETLSFEGWDKLKVALPEDTKILSNLLYKFNEEHPNWKCNVIFN